MHSRVLGKPGRSMSLKRFMDYLKTKEGVWVCTREEIANHWRKAHPYDKEGYTAAIHAKVKKY